jgi:ubiquinone/menaquinone biosynthesis C-methylase UbiE
LRGSSEEYFDSIGAGWDRLREGFFSDRVRERALAVAEVERGREAADLGAGAGFITQGLVERGVRVIAVDRSPAMLDVLRGKFRGTGTVDCRAGEAESVPIVDAAVDYCFANMVLHHVERPLVAIEEMARILKPGGRVVVTDLDAHDFAQLRDEHHDRWMGFERERVRDWFRQAGLTDVRVDSLGETCCDGKGATIDIFVASGTKPQAG